MKTAILHREIGDITYLIDIEYDQTSLESGYAIVTKSVVEKEWQRAVDEEWLGDTGSLLFADGRKIELKWDELSDLEATLEPRNEQ